MKRATQSELRTFKQCRRRWWLGNYRGLQHRRDPSIVRGPAALGTVVHKALEDVYTYGHAEALERLEQFYLDALEQYPVLAKEIKRDGRLARAMVKGYWDWAEEQGLNEGIEVLGTEERVEAGPWRMSVPLGGGYRGGREFTLLGKVDQRVRETRSGRVKARDYKTVQTLEDRYPMALNEQSLHYHLIMRLLWELSEQGDPPPDGTDFIRLRKVGRSKTAKPPFYFVREVRHSDEALRVYWRRVQAVLRDMFEVELALERGEDHQEWAYPTPGPGYTACEGCPFTDVCPLYDDGTPEDEVEDIIAEWYEQHDPLDRYAPTDVSDCDTIDSQSDKEPA